MTAIDTDRLHLRPWEYQDVDDLYQLTLDDRMRTFLGTWVPSREDSHNRLLRNGGCWHFLGWGPFKAIERESGEIVGNIGLFDGFRGLGEDFDPYPEAGWIVRHQSWGRGYASEAMSAILDWFDREHGGGRTVCMISIGNKGSERIAEKLGYRPIGLGEYKGEELMRYAREA